jgi:hypothetical protein
MSTANALFPILVRFAEYGDDDSGDPRTRAELGVFASHVEANSSIRKFMRENYPDAEPIPDILETGCLFNARHNVLITKWYVLPA